MSFGLRVWDGAGNQILNIVDRLTRFISQFNLSIGANSSVTVSVPGITADGTWFVYYVEPFAGATINNGSVTVNNGLATSSISVVLLVFRC